MIENKITIKGAREHNLQNIDVEIPRDQLVVITGLSGSGKSSLAFDTIYAEGQRRYIESLSSYARQFLGQMHKPDVDYISGLSPAISIDQKSRSKNPRSTVGTVTEIYDYLRLLYAHVGTPHCPQCGRTVAKQSVDEIVEKILNYPPDTKIMVMAPLVKGRKGEYQHLFEKLKKKGYSRVRVDSEIYLLEDKIPLKKNIKHTIEVIIDRITVKKENRQRLAESIEIGLQEGEHQVTVLKVGDKTEQPELYSDLLACPFCDISLPEILPRTFSFNNPFGACPECKGLGDKYEFDPAKIIPDQTLSLQDGAVEPWRTQMFGFTGQKLQALSQKLKFDLHTPFKDLPAKIKNIILYGTNEKIDYEYTSRRGDSHYQWSGGFEGVINQLDRLYQQTDSEYRREEMAGYQSVRRCPSCHGKKLNPAALAVTINKKNIIELTELSINNLLLFFKELVLNKKEQQIAEQILKEINARLSFLANVGLEYLSLSRSSATLSGGESQRIRLATQIGSGLVGVLYVLDEPSIGLHQRDNERLIETLKHLRSLGNTLIVVEHDEETITSADHVIDMGPGAGKYGGKITAAGTVEEIKKNPASLTGQYLTGKKKIGIPKERRAGNGKNLILSGAGEHNLKNITLDLPLGKLICVTGVSGSGKSTLISDTLYPVLMNTLYGSHIENIKYSGISGTENIDKVIVIDQDPIGRTPRSNPATYTGMFTHIRELFSQLPEAKIRGYKPGRFSFNIRGGRCEACEGDGLVKIEMHFLPDVYIPCDVCKGARYNKETLEVKYKGHTIADVLDMTVADAHELFKNIPAIEKKLSLLKEVGLDYIHLGQSATTLSGGEAQRIKLAAELSKRATGKTLYILDEPTTGLHFDDINNLLNVLNRLTDYGNTVLVIEHNLDVVKSADHVIDLGPEGGEKGGEIIATGTPEEIIKNKKSLTRQYLKKLF